jgi:hypothetical protein
MDLATARLLVPQRSSKRVRTRYLGLAPETIPSRREDKSKSGSNLISKSICHFSLARIVPSVLVAKKKSPKNIDKITVQL